MVSFNIQKVKDPLELSKLASKVISQQIDNILAKKDRFQIALSGGSTPRKTYSLLRDEILPWHRVDVFLGDERWVSHTNEASNALLLRETLLVSGPASSATFYPVPTVELQTPEDSAKEFSRGIRKVCKGDPPCFDLILLGLGDDGHTASLFPETESLNAKDDIATVSKGKGQHRITLTAEVLSASEKVIFLVSGKSKQLALKRLLEPNESYKRTPAKLVQPNSEILILADEVAASLI